MISGTHEINNINKKKFAGDIQVTTILLKSSTDIKIL